jgi:hypothetical protein
MAKRKEIEVDGLRELRRDLSRLENKGLLNELRQAHKDASERAAKAAVSEAPERSGRLAKSIKPKPKNSEGRVKAGTGKRVPYAGPIHFGWRNRGIEPNQFIYRGISKVIKDIQKDYERDINRIAKKLGRRFNTK